jgi:NRPS condensation-like uncharacterized protein
MNEEEWKTKIDNFVELKEGIHNEIDLANFMTSQQVVRESLNSTQYKFILLPDYNQSESVIMMKIHHSMFDGLGGAAFCLALSDECDIKSMPALKPLPCYTKLIVYLLMPILVPLKSL